MRQTNKMNHFYFIYLLIYSYAQVGLLVTTCLTGTLFCIEASKKDARDVMEAALAILLIAELDNAFGSLYWSLKVGRSLSGRRFIQADESYFIKSTALVEETAS